jgi:peptide/nickel transport system substrate-binding protein
MQFFFNTQLSPTDDVIVRRALIHAVDRSYAVNTVFGVYSVVAHSPFSASAFNLQSQDLILDYDPTRAEALLEAAGWTDEDGDDIRSKNNIPLELHVVSPTWGSNPEVAQLIRANWETIGAKVILEVAPGFGPLKEAQTQGEYHAIGINLFGTDPDLLRSFFSSNGLYNWTGFTDPEQDQLLLQAAQTSHDTEERLRLYQQFVSDVQEEALLLPIRFYVNLVVANKRVKGLHFSAQGWYPILIDLRITH